LHARRPGPPQGNPPTVSPARIKQAHGWRSVGLKMDLRIWKLADLVQRRKSIVAESHNLGENAFLRLTHFPGVDSLFVNHTLHILPELLGHLEILLVDQLGAAALAPVNQL